MRQQKLPDREERQPLRREEDEQHDRRGGRQALVAVAATGEEPAQTLRHGGHPATVPKQRAGGTPVPDGLRPRDEQHCAVARARVEGVDEELQPDGEGEGLVSLQAPEGHELLGLRPSGEDVAVGDGSHRDVGDDRRAVTGGDRHRERIRSRQRRPARRRRQAAWRGGGQEGDEPAVGRLSVHSRACRWETSGSTRRGGRGPAAPRAGRRRPRRA